MDSITTRALRSIRNDSPSVFAEKVYRKTRLAITGLPVLDALCLRQSTRRLHARMQRGSGPSDVLDTVYGFRGFGRYQSIKPMHARANATALLEEARSHDPNVIVEIGAGRGGSFYLWSRGVPSASLVVSIDLQFKTGRLLQSVDADAETRLIEGNSHHIEVRDQLEAVLDGRCIDLLYIDGDHSYDGVLQDFEMYSPLVSDGGIVVLDDVDNTTSAPGVVEAWSDLKCGRDTDTIKESSESSSQGTITF